MKITKQITNYVVSKVNSIRTKEYETAIKEREKCVDEFKEEAKEIKKELYELAKKIKEKYPTVELSVKNVDGVFDIYEHNNNFNILFALPPMPFNYYGVYTGGDIVIDSILVELGLLQGTVTFNQIDTIITKIYNENKTQK